MHIFQYPRRLFLGLSVFALCALLFAACSGGSGANGSGATPQAQNTTTTGSGVTPTPGIAEGPQSCPISVQDPAHWDPIVPTQNGTSKVETVSCGYLMGVPSLQAMIMVRHTGTGGILDVYVYNNIVSASPAQIFKLQGLYKGDAKISLYNTVMTAEVDLNSSANLNQSNAGLRQDLYREFKWSDSLGTLVPIAFPGIFPDLTRYQAEADQAQVNQGRQAWKLSATMTAQALGATLLKWNPEAPATLASGGGTQDVAAVVTLKNTAPGSGTITITMQRLEQNANGGIWIVVEVKSDAMAINEPVGRDRLSSPTTVTGTGNAFGDVIGTVTILDHLYVDIGHAPVKGAAGSGNTTFSTVVAYNSTFKQGIQEGLVMLAVENRAGGGASAAVIVKVMLS